MFPLRSSFLRRLVFPDEFVAFIQPIRDNCGTTLIKGCLLWGPPSRITADPAADLVCQANLELARLSIMLASTNQQILLKESPTKHPHVEGVVMTSSAGFFSGFWLAGICLPASDLDSAP